VLHEAGRRTSTAIAAHARTHLVSEQVAAGGEAQQHGACAVGGAARLGGPKAGHAQLHHTHLCVNVCACVRVGARARVRAGVCLCAYVLKCVCLM